MDQDAKLHLIVRIVLVAPLAKIATVGCALERQAGQSWRKEPTSLPGQKRVGEKNQPAFSWPEPVGEKNQQACCRKERVGEKNQPASSRRLMVRCFSCVFGSFSCSPHGVGTSME